MQNVVPYQVLKIVLFASLLGTQHYRDRTRALLDETEDIGVLHILNN